MLMILLNFIKWWYVQGWLAESKKILSRIGWVNEKLSTEILLKTLFSPWKQTQETAVQHASVSGKMQLWAGNMVSRFIGFFMRSALLLLSLLSSIFLIFYGVLTVLLWPLAPFALIIFPLLEVLI